MNRNCACISACLVMLCALVGMPETLRAENPTDLDRCEVVPLPDHQVSMRIDGVEKTRWHFGSQYPRPFFYPLNGPSGASLTRMGHPGAPNHDHHRSIWFAHHDVDGVNFWTDQTDARVRQKQWRCYEDGDAQAVMASVIGWYDGDNRECMEQELIATLIPMPDGEHAVEIQITMRPSSPRESVTLGKTNFGFLAVRVAKTLSVHFGGGTISDSEGRQGEKAIFGKQARWVDYSGPVAVGSGAERKVAVEGITFFDHPASARYPSYWHVREDGWMGASFCMQSAFTLTRKNPLTLRYLLHAHRGPYDATKAQAVHDAFAKRPGFQLSKSKDPHRQFTVTSQR